MIDLPVYEVFRQVDRGEPHWHVGSVHAADPQMALMLATPLFTRRGGISRAACVNLWVAREDKIAKTRYVDSDMFEHATDTSYREPWGYKAPRRARALGKD